MSRVSPDDLLALHETPHDVVSQLATSAQPPRVTVAISLYNYERYILECLESVHLQTLEDLDLIVVDDCSRDDSVETTRRWLSAHWQRFRKGQLLRHRANQGLAATRNLFFTRAETEYVFVLDADNTLYPRCTEVLAKALDRCDASFAYSFLEKFGAERGIESYRPWDARELQKGNYIDAMSMIRKSAWVQVGGYSTDMDNLGWEDFDFWLKIAEKGGWGVRIPEFLSRYRVHLSSMCKTHTNLKIRRIWDHLERKHPYLERPPHVSENWYRDEDHLFAQCERLRGIRESSGRSVLEVRGWALARSGIARVDLAVDGRPVGQARYGDHRADLREHSAGYPNEAYCGFSAHVSLPDESRTGEHALIVRATGTSGKTLELREAFTVQAEPVGELSDWEVSRVHDRILDGAGGTGQSGALDCRRGSQEKGAKPCMPTELTRGIPDRP